ncbi:hypothetical protein PHMEG_00022813 [Phytophthora megakarya]|uniref:Uncharacterized protein n=1 Tax=Phytophthora megakarya TaxID=4795 RepID=A0A225VHU3_9STRA|nr:hypothetical protein PHMEG_00022813 [Phytophthora megakarya]
MVGAAEKTPRHTLTAHEKHLCLEAMLSDHHERRLRHAEQKSTTGEAKEIKQKEYHEAYDGGDGDCGV